METNAQLKRAIWIGMVEVEPVGESKLLAGAGGAFVNVLTWASDAEEFRRKSEELMEYLGMRVGGIEAAEPLTNRGPEEYLDDEIRWIASEVRRNPSAIRYSTFHTWDERLQ